MFILGDGNFKLQLKRKNRAGREVHLMDAFFQTPEELEAFMKHTKPVSDVSIIQYKIFLLFVDIANTEINMCISQGSHYAEYREVQIHGRVGNNWLQMRSSRFLPAWCHGRSYKRRKV